MKYLIVAGIILLSGCSPNTEHHIDYYKVCVDGVSYVGFSESYMGPTPQLDINGNLVACQ